MIKYILVFMILIFASSAVMAQEMAIIVNKGVSESSLSSDDLSAIYSLKKTTWGNGSAIAVFDSKDGGKQDKFYGFIKKSYSALKKVWLKKKLTEGAKVPKGAGSDAEMINFVKNTPGAVGYVEKSAVTDDVKVVGTF